jgi:hypothetical protein
MSMPMSPSRRELFRVDPNDFVARRTELVRELRGRGEKDQAAEIKALRRPTVPVWALNQVASEQNELVEQLMTTAAAARAAQQALLEGNAADNFRSALARRREAMAAVSDAADDVVERSNRSRETYTREIEKALNVVVASPELSNALGRGELEDVTSGADDSEEMFAGFSPAAASDRPPSPKSPKSAKSAKTPRSTHLQAVPAPRPSARLVKAREKLDEQRGELHEAEQAAHAAERAVAAAESDVAQATKALERATASRDRARDQVDRLQARVEQSEQLVQRLVAE